MDDVVTGNADASVIVAAVFFAMVALAFGYMATVNIRQLVRPRPLLRVDSLGLECCVGRVLWTDAERVSIGRTDLTVRLRPDAQPQEPRLGYTSAIADGGDAGLWSRSSHHSGALPSAHGIWIATSQPQRTRDVVSRYFRGVIEEPVSGEGRYPGDC